MVKPHDLLVLVGWTHYCA